MLNKLYPACSSGSLPKGRRFDPTEQSLGEKSRTKKKAAVPHGGKSRSITAVLLKHPLARVPRGGVRKQLAREGRLRKMQIRRTMSASEIKRMIKNCFSTFESAKNVKFMKSEQDNSLKIMVDQDLDGAATADVAGGGSLYLIEVSPFLILIYAHVISTIILCAVIVMLTYI